MARSDQEARVTGGPSSPAEADRLDKPPEAGRPQAPSSPPRTRTSSTFIGFVAGAVVLLLLLIFIVENTTSVKISYFGAHGHLPLGVALLLAAVGGALLVAVIGAARIAQLRRHARRRLRDSGEMKRPA